MKPVVVYPRGFLGYDIGLPIRTTKDSVSEILSSLKYNKHNKPEPRVVVSNAKVEELLKQLLLGTGHAHTQQWRESVILAALEAFGTRSFYDWCNMQSQSPCITDLHIRFLNDTLKYIETGVRECSMRHWQKLVHPAPVTLKPVVEFTYKQFFGAGRLRIVSRPTMLHELIPQWVGQPNGYADLLETLNILFGEN